MSAAGRPGPGADEGDHLGDRRGQRPRPAQQPLGEVLRLVGAVERRALGDLPEQGHERVVLEVVADAGQLVRGPRSPTSRRSSGGPMPESSRSCGEPIAPAARITSRSARAPSRRPRGPVADADRASALELEAGDLRAGDHLEVRPRQRRAQEPVGGAPPAPASLGDLEHRRAVLLGPVVVGDHGDARGGARVEQSPVERPRRALLLDPQLAAGAVELRRRRARCPRSAGSRAARRPSPIPPRPASPTGRSRAAGRARRASRSSSSTRRGSCRAGCRASARRRAARARWRSPSRAWCGTGSRTRPGS